MSNSSSAQFRASSRMPGAVVLGGDYQGLGIVRSLGRRGVPVCVIDDEHSVARYSKYCKQTVHVEKLRGEQETVTELIKIGKQLDLNGWVLYPTRDEHVAAFSRRRAELSQLFRVPTPDWETIQWAWDKRNTYELAKQLEIPVPGSYYPGDVTGLSELDQATPPFAIKPAIKEHFIYQTKAKAWCANTHAELKALFLKASEFMDPAEIIVQEVIPGGGSQQFAYCAFFRDGRAIGSMTTRRLRQHPLQFGRASTYVETVEVPAVVELAERFLQKIHYYGLVEVEFKLDPRDGHYKLLDVNARTWGYNSLGSCAGVDFAYMLYADQVGLPVSNAVGCPGVGWMRLITDLPTAVVGLLAGEVKVSSYAQSLKECSTDAVFSREDPLPGLAEVFLVPYLAIRRGF